MNNMEHKIPTIEDFYIQHYGVCPMIEKEIALHSHKDMIKFAKEFAKLHVEAALKQASEKAYYRDFNEYVCRSEENKQSILNAYPLTNIK
jgi:hypothetical protein